MKTSSFFDSNLYRAEISPSQASPDDQASPLLVKSPLELLITFLCVAIGFLCVGVVLSK